MSLLKPADGPGEEGEEVSRDQGPPPIQVEDEEIYQVRELLNSRRRGRMLQYLVDWEVVDLGADRILAPGGAHVGSLSQR